MGQGQKVNNNKGSTSVDDIYSMYIQQQQNLIIQQQQQINELYQMNLDQAQQTHQMSNMVFQQMQQQQQQNQQQQITQSISKKITLFKIRSL